MRIVAEYRYHTKLPKAQYSRRSKQAAGSRQQQGPRKAESRQQKSVAADVAVSACRLSAVQTNLNSTATQMAHETGASIQH